MSADLTRCCCGGGCGCVGGCNGNFFPDTISLTFTPHFSGAWTGGVVCIPGVCGCSGAVTPPTGYASGATTLGGYLEWFTSPVVNLTLTATDDGSSCTRSYTSDTVAATEPSGLPAWSENPLELSSSAAKWCEIATDMEPFGGSNGYFQDWSATLIAMADSCNSDGVGGTDTNTIMGYLVIKVSSNTVMRRRLIITSSEEECSCYLVNYGATDWGVHCSPSPFVPGQCWSSTGFWANNYFALKTDWGGDWGLGTQTQSWTTDRGNDCCEDLTAVWYYIGGADIEDSVLCVGADDNSRLIQTSHGLTAPVTSGPGNSGGTIHYGDGYDVSEDSPCGSPCIVAGEYGFSLSTQPAITDISLDTP